MANKSKNKIVDLRKRGTLVLGEYRCGTHYLLLVAEEICRAHARLYKNHDEWFTTRGDTKTFFDSLSSDPVYHLVIINQLESKIEFMKSGIDLADWHVIRVVPDDRERWFMSWYFYLHADTRPPDQPIKVQHTTANLNGREVWFVGTEFAGDYYDLDSRQYIASWSADGGGYTNDVLIGTEKPSNRQMMHHNTESIVYKRWLRKNRPLPFDVGQFPSFFYMLHGQMLNAMLPADMEISTSALASLETETVRWKPNQYPPQLSIEADWENGWYIKQMLDRWTPLPGRSKEKR